MQTTEEYQLKPQVSIYHQILRDITEAYLEDSRPWVVGFSGGKDSTALMILVYRAISALSYEQRHKPIYVLASDTRVETPKISSRIQSEINSISTAAKRDGLPITAHLVYPKLNDTFWVNIIGRGYPSPTSKFRWCTDRLKIYPVSDFIQRVIHESGEVVIVLGGRKAESSTRAQTMNRHVILGSRYRPHTQLHRAWVYTPIEDLSNNEIWTFLLQVKSPWQGDNRGLITLYKQASGGECPLVIDRSTPSCGHSRFGCWTCTVVDRDKSMEALIAAGEDHLEPLLELREYLQEIRETAGSRYDVRRNGSKPLRRGTQEEMVNTGPFTHSTRMDLLRRVLLSQRSSGISLIEGDELAIIQEIWNQEEAANTNRQYVPVDAVERIWNHVYEGGTMPETTASYEHLNDESELLLRVCESEGVPYELLVRLRDIEEQYGHLKRRHGLPNDMREIIEEFANPPAQTTEDP